MSSYLVWIIACWSDWGKVMTSDLSLGHVSNSGRESKCWPQSGQLRFGLYCSLKSFLIDITVLDLNANSFEMSSLLNSGLFRYGWIFNCLYWICFILLWLCCFNWRISNAYVDTFCLIWDLYFLALRFDISVSESWIWHFSKSAPTSL